MRNEDHLEKGTQRIRTIKEKIRQERQKHRQWYLREIVDRARNIEEFHLHASEYNVDATFDDHGQENHSILTEEEEPPSPCM